jgi:hypothetical protein
MKPTVTQQHQEHIRYDHIPFLLNKRCMMSIETFIPDLKQEQNCMNNV